MRARRTLRTAAPGAASESAEAARQPHLVLVPGAFSAPDSTARRQEFGPRLKAARERRGIALEEIARATKVNPSLLHALERGDVSRWPKGIFRRAFFRDYVAALGLPPDAYVREFLELFPDGEEHPVALPAQVVRLEVPPALRLTLAAGSRWAARRRDVRDALADFPAILMLAVALTWWTDAGLAAGAGTVAICYYPRAAAIVRRRISAARRRRTPPPA